MSLLDESSRRDYLDEVQEWLGTPYHNIGAARKLASQREAAITFALVKGRLIPDDASFVVFGSLARGEWTSGSDLDWSLLIDGGVDPTHLKIAHRIREALDALETKRPGREAVFGGLSFSHELVHHIGGNDDTNRNLTQRVLLLLESKPLGEEQAYERVVKAVLKRYCEEDAHIYSGVEHRFKVPRFLVNDIVRFWRTIAVDYVSKRRERDNKGWALRNAKLRLSRKLLFTSGILMCLQCRLKEVPGSEGVVAGGPLETEPLMRFLSAFVERPPLDIVCEALLSNGVKETAKDVLDSYDRFLGMLDDPQKREDLDGLPYENAENSALFQEVRGLGGVFQKGLDQLFFVDNEALAKLAREYGMF